MIHDLLTDIRYALRGFAHKPGPMIVAVLALSLGIGANVSSFMSVSAMVLHAFPYPRSDRIMTLWETAPRAVGERNAVAPANLRDWKQQATSFEYIAAYRAADLALSGGDRPERVRSFAVSPEFFDVLGTSASSGRALSADDEQPGRDSVVVLSHYFWLQRLGGMANAVGQKLELNGRSYTVVGVMPEDFDYPLAADIWVPLALTDSEKNDRTTHTLFALGLLRPGISAAAATAELQTIAGRQTNYAAHRSSLCRS